MSINIRSTDHSYPGHSNNENYGVVNRDHSKFVTANQLDEAVSVEPAIASTATGAYDLGTVGGTHMYGQHQAVTQTRTAGEKIATVGSTDIYASPSVFMCTVYLFDPDNDAPDGYANTLVMSRCEPTYNTVVTIDDEEYHVLDKACLYSYDELVPAIHGQNCRIAGYDWWYEEIGSNFAIQFDSFGNTSVTNDMFKIVDTGASKYIYITNTGATAAYFVGAGLLFNYVNLSDVYEEATQTFICWYGYSMNYTDSAAMQKIWQLGGSQTSYFQFDIAGETSLNKFYLKATVSGTSYYTPVYMLKADPTAAMSIANAMSVATYAVTPQINYTNQIRTSALCANVQYAGNGLSKQISSTTIKLSDSTEITAAVIMWPGIKQTYSSDGSVACEAVMIGAYAAIT